MELEQAKKIMENAEPEVFEAYKTISSKQLMIFINNYKKQLKEKQEKIDFIYKQRNHLCEAKNFEDLQNMVKNIHNHGDTK